MSPSRPAPAGTVEIWFSHGNLLECSQGIIYTGPRPAHRISNLYGTRDSSFKDNINRVADDELCEAGTNIGVSICVYFFFIQRNCNYNNNMPRGAAVVLSISAGVSAIALHSADAPIPVLSRYDHPFTNLSLSRSRRSVARPWTVLRCDWKQY